MEIKPFDQLYPIRILHFLKAEPYLIYGDSGLNSVAKKFGITLAELKIFISEYKAKNQGGENNA